MGLFKALITFGIGIYAGMYIEQNYRVPKIEVKEAREQCRKFHEQVHQWMEEHKKEKTDTPSQTPAPEKSA